MLSRIKDSIRLKKEKVMRKVIDIQHRMDIQVPNKSTYLRSLSAGGNLQHKKPHQELASRLIQENKKRSQLPSYHGLDRFEIIQKIGE